MGRGKWTSSTSTSTRGDPPHMSRRCVTKPGMPLHIKFRLCPFVARLIVGGDFNTPCTTSAPHSGPGVLRKMGQGIQDADEFAAIIQGLDLVVLNTYQQSVPAHTYHWNQQKSQIDFWLTRRLHAGGKAKAATPLPALHVGRWRGGPRHLPVQAWVMYHWQPWEHKRFQAATSSTEVDRMDILQALHNEKDNRITQFSQGSPGDDREWRFQHRSPPTADL